MPARRALVAMLCVALVGGALIAFRVAGSSSPAAAPDDPVLAAPALPASAKPAFAIPAPQQLGRAREGARSAVVLRAVRVRSAPSTEATVVEELDTRTPEQTSNVVLVEGRAEDSSGRLWNAVRVSALPHNVVGWVPRSSLGASDFVSTRLVVDTRALTATLFDGDREIFEAGVGVGRPQWPTPTGDFYVRSRIDSLSAFYGPLAFGTSARSAVLTDWPGGGFVGIHGTDAPELLPGRVSHGCIRMRNEDILRLGELMHIGTPVAIR